MRKNMVKFYKSSDFQLYL